ASSSYNPQTGVRARNPDRTVGPATTTAASGTGSATTEADDEPARPIGLFDTDRLPGAGREHDPGGGRDREYGAQQMQRDHEDRQAGGVLHEADQPLSQLHAEQDVDRADRLARRV